MLNRLQVVFIVVLGADIVLGAILLARVGPPAAVVVALPVALTYIAFISRRLLGADDAIVRRVFDAMWKTLLDTPGRATMSSSAAAVACAVLVVQVWPRTEQVTLQIGVVPQPLPVAHGLDELRVAEFVVTLRSLEYEDVRHVSPGDTATFEVPALNDEAPVRLTVQHGLYTDPGESRSFGEMRHGLMLEPKHRPLASFELEGVAEPKGYALFAEADGKPESETLSPFDADGHGLLVCSESDWWAFHLINPDGDRAFLRHMLVDGPFVGIRIDGIAELAFRSTNDLVDDDGVGVTRIAAADPVGETLQPGDGSRFAYGGLPRNEDLLINEHFVIAYDTARKAPQWVAYKLAPTDGVMVDRPTNAWRADTRVSAQPGHGDFSGPHYDRGHLISPRDMYGHGEAAVRDTYLYTAIVAQTPASNRRAWLEVERYCQAYAEFKGQAPCILSGPAYLGSDGRPIVGDTPVLAIGDGVVVPTHLWRIMLQYWKNEIAAICFLVPNTADVSGDPVDYLVSVDELEAATGLDFFPELVETLDESARAEGLWPVE